LKKKLINKNMANKFNLLFEREVSRFELGGFLVGDRVRIKKEALKDEYVLNRAQSFQDFIKSLLEPTFDLNLRIGAVKSIYPTTSQNYAGSHTDSPTAQFADVYTEYAPGLVSSPVTLPLHLLSVVSDGNNRGPIPNSLRRKSKIHGPEEIKTTPDDLKAEINLKNQNVVLPNSNKWDDTKPGGGNFITK
jgi:hypothetical protein